MPVHTTVFLAAPACEEECFPCLRRCALGRVHLNWWEKEEERLLRERVSEGDPHRQDWLAQLGEAQEQLQRLRQETKPSAPSFRDGAWREGSPGSPARARLH